MEAIQIIIIIFGIFALSRAVLRVKERQMAITAFFFWLGIWAVLIFLALFPSVLSKIANVVGITSGTNLLVIFGVMLLFYLIFRLHIRIGKVESDLSNLVTKLAIKKK